MAERPIEHDVPDDHVERGLGTDLGVHVAQGVAGAATIAVVSTCSVARRTCRRQATRRRPSRPRRLRGGTVMVVGASRFVFCEECEEHTDQSVMHLSRNGMGEPIAQVWRCLKGDHYVGLCPGPVPPALNDLWEASQTAT